MPRLIFAFAFGSLLLLTVTMSGLLAADESDGQTADSSEQKEAVDSKASPEAVERTRKTVRMLDDVYKSTIVLITDKYVNEADDYPAGSAAIDLFGEIEKKGWHKVRLIDVSGEPYDDENVARTPFEKQAVKKIRQGKGYVEEIATEEGQPVLRAATAVPVVMQKCVMCHANYEDAKEGEAIGAVIYRLPIE